MAREILEARASENIECRHILRSLVIRKREKERARLEYFYKLEGMCHQRTRSSAYAQLRPQHLQEGWYILGVYLLTEVLKCS